MARSFYQSLLLAAAILGAAPWAVAEPPAATPGQQQVVDPYYLHRANAQQYLGRPGLTGAGGFVQSAQYEELGEYRPSLLDPLSTEPGDESYYGDADADLSYDSCGGDTCGAGHGLAGDCGSRGFFGGGGCDPCHSGYRIWANFDYLNFKVHGDGIPPLLTTSPLGTAQGDAGVLGEPGTSVLFGNERLNNDQRSGGRVQIGYWLDEEGYTAVEGHYYALETVSQSFAASSTFSNPPSDSRILARPFNNIFLNVNDSLILAYPDFVIGGVTVNLDGTFSARASSDVQSAGVLLRQLWLCNPAHRHRLYLLGGYRFFRLAENLQINNTIEPVGGVFPPGIVFASHDQFDTRNLFHGVDFGVASELQWWRLSVETLVKVAVGNMHQNLDIAGFSTTSDGPITTVREGGLLALPTNIGQYNRDRLTFIPEVDVKLGYQVTPTIRATIGYNFTYVSRVMRPGHQLDLVVNPTQRSGPLEGPARPLPVLTSTDVFLQGVTAGLEFRY